MSGMANITANSGRCANVGANSGRCANISAKFALQTELGRGANTGTEMQKCATTNSVSGTKFKPQGSESTQPILTEPSNMMT